MTSKFAHIIGGNDMYDDTEIVFCFEGSIDEAKEELEKLKKLTDEVGLFEGDNNSANNFYGAMSGTYLYRWSFLGDFEQIHKLTGLLLKK